MIGIAIRVTVSNLFYLVLTFSAVCLSVTIVHGSFFYGWENHK